jgi:hypothetical protein
MKYWNGANMDEEFVRRIIEKGEYDENCSHLHVESCNIKALVMFARGVKSLYRIYLLAHLIPLFLFRFKRLKKKYPLFHIVLENNSRRLCSGSSAPCFSQEEIL